MADIVIRGMEMPKTCCECDLKTYDPEKVWNDNGIERIGVWVCKRTGEVIWNTQRGENCPLVPLPEEHGRLIDVDALENMELETCDTDDGFRTKQRVAGRNHIRKIVKSAPIILEAEVKQND